ncbi:MAG TPA: TetR-like C-terminal domain-containing protein [Bacilli bacterium]|nr:TetR-like C-terminal domain-containing protein [Bacilli bacterium]
MLSLEDNRANIIGAFKRLMQTKKYEEVTLKSILSEVKLSKYAFYKVFSAKQDVVATIFQQEILEDTLYQMNKDNYRDRMQSFIAYLKRHREFYVKVFPLERQQKLKHMFDLIIEKQISILAMTFLDGKRLQYNDQRYINDYFTSAFAYLVNEWIGGRYRFDGQEFVDKWVLLINAGLKDFIFSYRV